MKRSVQSVWGWAWMGLLPLATLAQTNPTPTAGTTSAAEIVAPVAATNAARDAAAARFLNTCAGCHSLSGVKLTGPDLSHVGAWPPDQLRAAIARMEKNVGPLAPTDITELDALLRAPDLRERLQTEGARIQAQFAAKLAPADPALGRRLFTGAASLRGGGLACASCHRVAGRGGNLGPDLTGVHARLGEGPLISAITKAAYKIMAPHYQRHPITPQEALHLTAYLATLDPAAAPAVAHDFLPVGAGLAAVAFAGLVAYGRRDRPAHKRLLTRRERKG